jgi:PBP1b-binding outer membrane lipoprotein LpoB
MTKIDRNLIFPQWWFLAGCCGYAQGYHQYSKPHVHASGVVSCRLLTALATTAETTIDAAQPTTTHGHAGT